MMMVASRGCVPSAVSTTLLSGAEPTVTSPDWTITSRCSPLGKLKRTNTPESATDAATLAHAQSASMGSRGRSPARSTTRPGGAIRNRRPTLQTHRAGAEYALPATAGAAESTPRMRRSLLRAPMELVRFAPARDRVRSRADLLQGDAQFFRTRELGARLGAYARPDQCVEG